MNCNDYKHHKHLFRDLSILHRFDRMYLQNRLAGTSLEHCHPPYLITILHNEGLSQDDLARAFSIDKGSTSKTLRHMEDADFISRQQDEEDRRKYRIFLTEKGRASVPQLIRLAEETESILTKDMTEEEVTALRLLLGKATKNVLDVMGKGE